MSESLRNKETETEYLYPQPQGIALNNENGYILNTTTGDTIQPLIINEI
jgi:hypothetical protein